MAKIKKLYKKTGKDTKELIYPATITQAIKDGETGQNLHDYMNDVKPKFKFNATQTDGQLVEVGSIQLSQDGGKTWNDISPEFINNLRIQKYVATASALPSGQPVGTIYAVGPTYDAADTSQTNPIYTLYVYDGNQWVNNGKFTSIAAGVVQETGDSETQVMSQKATTEKLTELASRVYPLFDGTDIKLNLTAGVSINTSTINAGATPVYLYGNIRLHLSGNREGIDGNVSVLFLDKNGNNVITGRIVAGESITLKIETLCFYVGIYKSGSGILESGEYTLTLTNIDVELIEKDIVSLNATAKDVDKYLYLYDNRQEPLGVINSYYINNNGSFVSSTNQTIYYWHVNQGDKIKLLGAGLNNNYAAWALYDDIPTTSSKPISYVAWTDNIDEDIIIIEKDCYLATSFFYKGEGRYIAVGYPISDKINEIKSNSEAFIEKPESGVIEGYYIYKTGEMLALSSNNTKYWAVKKGDNIRIIGGQNNSYAAWAFYTDIPTTSSTPHSFKGWESEDDNYIVSPIDGYIARSGYKYEEYLYVPMAFKDVYDNLAAEMKNLKKEYSGKTCIYIGDSISTSNNYKWKGFIENNYKLKYVRDKSGELTPANGGITVIPPESENSDLAKKSIWYRCAEGRMSAYDFDIISLFGGTNDMANSSLVIGSVDDAAFVDNVEGFTDADNVTDVRPDTLTLASALRGCILMLMRDFPNKEIILPTVMSCGGSYGNWTDPSTGLKASLAIAEMQLKMAEKYSLKAIPLYWDMRTSESDARRIFTLDGVHPNMQGALRIQALFAQTLCL